MVTKLTAGDFIVFFISISFVFTLYVLYWGEDQHARHAEIIVSGKKQYILDLNEEKHLEITGKLGKSIIEVSNGQIRFVESSCSSKQCIRSGWISQVNALAACLPNGVSLHLVGPNARFDSINF